MSYSIAPETEETAEKPVNQLKLAQLMHAKQAEQSLLLAVMAGLLASMIAAAIWAAVTYATNYQIGFMAVGVGFLVGYSVRKLGKGMTMTFGIVGAAFSLFGCLLGNFLTSIVVLSNLEDSSMAMVLAAFASSPGIVVEIMKETFSPIDLLFYAIAIYQGYSLSIDHLTDEELASVQEQPMAV